MTVAITIGIYLLLVLGLGLYAGRLFRGTGEDYFVASRTIGPFVLLMSLFGTHMTAFSLLGASGEAYRNGIGVFALMASSSALVVPTVFYFVGIRLWKLGKQHGFVSPVQFFRARFESNSLGLVLFAILTALLVPYLLIGVMGAGITLDQMTDGLVPTWAGSLAVCIVIFLYVTRGGMRGTAWVNTFQTLVFMILGGTAFFVVVHKMGGLETAMNSVAQHKGQLLAREGVISPYKFLSYIFIPMSVGTFPHIFTHWLTAQKASTFKAPIIFYPLCVAIVWLPSVLLGVMGTVPFPDLVGPAANSVLVQMVDLYAPGLLGGLLAAGVFAAIMSSLDSQVLSLGNMFTQDVVSRFKFHDQMDQKSQVWYGRFFVIVILAVSFGLSLVTQRSIFSLGIWSFTGFSALFPIVVAGLYWRRCTLAAVWSAVIAVALGWTYFFLKGQVALPGSGVLVVVPLVAVSTLLLFVVSSFTSPPQKATLQRFFAD